MVSVVSLNIFKLKFITVIFNLKSKSTTRDGTTSTQLCWSSVVIEGVTSHGNSGNELTSTGVDTGKRDLGGEITVESDNVRARSPLFSRFNGLCSSTCVEDNEEISSTRKGCVRGKISSQSTGDSSLKGSSTCVVNVTRSNSFIITGDIKVST